MTYDLPLFSVSMLSEAVDEILCSTLPAVRVTGEIANYRLSRGQWVYFDIRDKMASLHCFAAAARLPGPLEDGLMIELVCRPGLHRLYGFTLNVQHLAPVGEGALKRAAELLKAKLMAEGLFDSNRKRPLPYPPQAIGLLTSSQAAAYRDFVKILEARWPLMKIYLADVAVQGINAGLQIIDGLHYLNGYGKDIEAIVITRGGGDSTDLAVFNDERLVRAVAGSRLPVMAAIGHERDVCLVEMAADARASTPSNAAELLAPDKKDSMSRLEFSRRQVVAACRQVFGWATEACRQRRMDAASLAANAVGQATQQLKRQAALIRTLNPANILARGYSVVRLENGTLLRRAGQAQPGTALTIRLAEGQLKATTQDRNV